MRVPLVRQALQVRLPVRARVLGLAQVLEPALVQEQRLAAVRFWVNRRPAVRCP